MFQNTKWENYELPTALGVKKNYYKLRENLLLYQTHHIWPSIHFGLKHSQKRKRPLHRNIDLRMFLVHIHTFHMDNQ